MFDTMDASDLNKRLKDLMDGLSVKVCLLSQVATLGFRNTPADDCQSPDVSECPWRTFPDITLFLGGLFL